MATWPHVLRDEPSQGPLSRECLSLVTAVLRWFRPAFESCLPCRCSLYPGTLACLAVGVLETRGAS
eukprot:6485545-Prymnesium_polylepis.1